MVRSRFGWAALLLVVALLGTAWIAFSRVPLQGGDSLETLAEAPIPLGIGLRAALGFLDLRGCPRAKRSQFRPV